jgi:ribosomal RNA-processing protein 8
MFAVKGWSVSADSLKAETAVPGSGAVPASKTKSKSKKRKRDSAVAEEVVTSENVADLWHALIQKDSPSQDTTRKGENGTANTPAESAGGDVAMEPDSSTPVSKSMRKRLRKKAKEQAQQYEDRPAAKGVKQSSEGTKKLNPKDASTHRTLPAQLMVDQQVKETANTSKKRKTEDKVPVKATADVGALLIPRSSASLKLTPLQASMRDKLVSARFRSLNESLYTKPSDEALRMFEDQPEMFREYHEGFRRQVGVWPENPVDCYIRDIRTRTKGRSLPRTEGVCTIADLGCGDARLAESLASSKQKLKLEILSYDLQSPSPLVTKADIANLPLEDGSVDVAIFCLALMGTNWLSFIEEAYRVLRWKGELWIAEIKSRFGHVSNKRGGVPVIHSVGNRKKAPTNNRSKPKGRGGQPDGNDDGAEDLEIEVDGADDKRQDTDVSAFIRALNKRGFILHAQNPEPVDLSNTMFVRMHFVKGSPTTKGKGIVEPVRPKTGKRFLADDDRGEDESGILKPCLYKVR